MKAHFNGERRRQSAQRRRGSLQIAPEGGIIPGLIDKVEVQPYIEGVPGMGPPGMPAPWESGH